jgi:hypothetical protein
MKSDAYLLPEQSFPGRESRRLEQSVLKDSLNTTKGLNNIGTVSVEIPQFTVVSLACPPEWIRLHVLVDLELGSGSETLVE